MGRHLCSSFDLTSRYISTCAKGGINFNKKKIRFSEDEVEYVGSKVTDDSIVPADSMTESIRNFPEPRNITNARAFFGLVEQVSFTFSKCADMAAFRHLLSPKQKFLWTEEFVLAKLNIVRKIHEGVRMFEVSRVTALCTDWAKDGQALGLWQKHCACEGQITIACCRGGWKIVFMSSRFNNDAQSRYSAIEGEALSVYWATNKADYFIYGCDKLYIGFDHKHLLAFFRKVDPKPLDQIVNKRQRKYVSEINSLCFTAFHISGAANYLADRGSRFPSGKAGAEKGVFESTVKSCAASSDLPADCPQGSTVKTKTVGSDLPADCPLIFPPTAQIFAYGANGPTFCQTTLEILTTMCRSQYVRWQLC